MATSNIDTLPVVPGDSSDLCLGANFPDNFFLFYGGQSIDRGSAVRAWISAHFHGRDKRYIGALVRASYPMFFVTRIGRKLAEREVGFRIGVDPPPADHYDSGRKKAVAFAII